MLGGAIVLVLILLGGGVWYANRNDSAAPTPTPTDASQPSVPTSVPDGGSDLLVPPANVVEFTVEGTGFKFTPATLTVKEGDTVRVTFKNTGGIHDFVIDEFDVATNQINDGEEEQVEFVASKKGSFEYYCSVGNHRQMGMKGTLVVE